MGINWKYRFNLLIPYSIMDNTTHVATSTTLPADSPIVKGSAIAGDSDNTRGDTTAAATLNTVTSLQLLDFKARIQKSEIAINNPPRKTDKQTRKLLLYLFTGTRGGLTRLKIILLLLDTPSNTHQIALTLKFDYKAIQHHLRVMEKNNIVAKLSDKYGATYHVSAFLEYNIHALDEVIDKLDRKLNIKKVYY